MAGHGLKLLEVDGIPNSRSVEYLAMCGAPNPTHQFSSCIIIYLCFVFSFSFFLSFKFSFRHISFIFIPNTDQGQLIVPLSFLFFFFFEIYFHYSSLHYISFWITIYIILNHNISYCWFIIENKINFNKFDRAMLESVANL